MTALRLPPSQHDLCSVTRDRFTLLDVAVPWPLSAPRPVAFSPTLFDIFTPSNGGSAAGGCSPGGYRQTCVRPLSSDATRALSANPLAFSVPLNACRNPGSGPQSHNPGAILAQTRLTPCNPGPIHPQAGQFWPNESSTKPNHDRVGPEKVY